MLFEFLNRKEFSDYLTFFSKDLMGLILICYKMFEYGFCRKFKFPISKKNNMNCTVNSIKTNFTVCKLQII